MAYYGRRVTIDTDYGATGNGTSNQVGQRYLSPDEDGWVTSAGILGGKASGQPDLTLRIGIFAISGSSLTTRHIFTGAITVSNVMSFGGDGSLLTGGLSFQMHNGRQLGLAFGVSGGIFNYGMKQQANNPGAVADFIFHKKSISGSTPTDPFGATSSSSEGGISLFLTYEPNVKPTVLTSTMVPSGSSTDSTPTFYGDWRDDNSDVGDAPLGYQIQVRQVGNTSLAWNYTGTFSSTEKTDQRFGQVYAGATLTPGITYEWRYKVSDQFELYSEWSHDNTWKSFSISGAGSVAIASGTPSGKQETQTPGPFTGVWSNTGALSTNAVEVRVKDAITGNILRTMASSLVVTVAASGTISVTWAQTGFSALSWGSNLVYNIRARATNNVWSDWSADRAFTINAQPTTPYSRSPSSGVVVTTRPLIRAKTSDGDDTTGTGLGINVRIKNAAGTLLFTRAMVFVTATGYFEYQTTATDLASFAEYRWDTIANDGTVSSSYSSELTFTYAAGPIITLTAPADLATITTNIPVLSFTQDTSQASWRLVVMRAGKVIQDQVFAQTAVAGAGGSHQIASGLLHNGDVISWYVTSTSTLGVTGTSATRTFTLTFPVLAGPTGLNVSPVGDQINLSWAVPNYGPDVFQGTNLLRRLPGEPLETAQKLTDALSFPDQNSFVDYYPASSQQYVYSVSFNVLQGTEVTETARVEQDSQVQLDHIVINSVADGGLKLHLRYGTGYDVDYLDDADEIPIWGQKLPHVMLGEQDMRVFAGAFELHTDKYSSGRDSLEVAKALRVERHTVCVRDYLGMKLFGRMVMKQSGGSRSSSAKLALTVRENDHREGV